MLLPIENQMIFNIDQTFIIDITYKDTISFYLYLSDRIIDYISYACDDINARAVSPAANGSSKPLPYSKTLHLPAVTVNQKRGHAFPETPNS